MGEFHRLFDAAMNIEWQWMQSHGTNMRGACTPLTKTIGPQHIRMCGCRALDHSPTKIVIRTITFPLAPDAVRGCHLETKATVQTVASLHEHQIDGVLRGIRLTSHLQARHLTQKRRPPERESPKDPNKRGAATIHGLPPTH
jgi:hypothetical protein